MNQLEQRCQMPWWLTVIIIIETLPMFLGPFGALNNSAFLGGPEATTVGFAAWLYAARNFAVGIAFVVAYFLRSAPMLFLSKKERLFNSFSSRLAIIKVF